MSSNEVGRRVVHVSDFFINRLAGTLPVLRPPSGLMPQPRRWFCYAGARQIRGRPVLRSTLLDTRCERGAAVPSIAAMHVRPLVKTKLSLEPAREMLLGKATNYLGVTLWGLLASFKLTA